MFVEMRTYVLTPKPQKSVPVNAHRKWVRRAVDSLTSAGCGAPKLVV